MRWIWQQKVILLILLMRTTPWCSFSFSCRKQLKIGWEADRLNSIYHSPCNCTHSVALRYGWQQVSSRSLSIYSTPQPPNLTKRPDTFPSVYPTESYRWHPAVSCARKIFSSYDLTSFESCWKNSTKKVQKRYKKIGTPNNFLLSLREELKNEFGQSRQIDRLSYLTFMPQARLPDKKSLINLKE